MLKFIVFPTLLGVLIAVQISILIALFRQVKAAERAGADARKLKIIAWSCLVFGIATVSVISFRFADLMNG